MLDSLDAVPWEDLEHAYGSASDVPDLLRRLLDPNSKERSRVLDELYGNVFHQGTRYPATPYVVPFLIEMCASPSVSNRSDLLGFWGSLITGYFSIQERPCWGDGEKIHEYGEIYKIEEENTYGEALHQIYRESLKGKELLVNLLNDNDSSIRAGAAWVLACLPTIAESTVPKLEAQLDREISGGVRAGIAFALGELSASTQLLKILDREQFSAAKCMAVCQLARINPQESLIEPLLEFVSQPISGYQDVFGAGGKSTDDAAFSISYLPRQIQQKAIPAICQRLRQARSLDTMPLVRTLLSATFEERNEPLTELTDLQNLVLSQMLMTDELWSIGNLFWTFRAYGLSSMKEECAKLVGIEITQDDALKELRSALAYAEIGFLEKAREGILKALEIDSAVFERVPTPEEYWLFYAKAFAESDPKQAIEAFRRAVLINPEVVNRVSPTWHLADLLRKNNF
ncbi:conserved hypothetical protein [Hyella patelloides LEGE 07179]|uniref:HEAT repeat domain-containing protein n=1 Tax=Hyella patelloides LEGE 07179 TaxID=945734 RepID=A0A563VJI8_9CYAN|nr:HEAT repeat domain-containing protein [Hyella patelloides]VEP11572.1 conserved hypothetical protein [Hyella patelloides LEGE 07179]